MSSAEKFKELAKKKELSPEVAEKFKKEWVQDVNELMDKFGRWLDEEGIEHLGYQTWYEDPVIGPYEVKTMRVTIGGLEDPVIEPRRTVKFPNLEVIIMAAKMVRIKRCKDRKWVIDDSISNLTKNNFFDALTYACGLEE